MNESKFTATLLGKIPHLQVFTDYGVIRAPVKLRQSSDGRGYIPVRANSGNALVYMLPGGVEYIA